MNFANNVQGGASVYGGAHLVLDKAHFGDRITMTSGNSFGHRDNGGVGTHDNPAAALAANRGALNAAGIRAAGPRIGAGYTEVQVWGSVPITPQAIRAVNLLASHANHPGIQRLAEHARSQGIPVNVWDEKTGRKV